MTPDNPTKTVFEQLKEEDEQLTHILSEFDSKCEELQEKTSSSKKKLKRKIRKALGVGDGAHGS